MNDRLIGTEEKMLAYIDAEIKGMPPKFSEKNAILAALKFLCAEMDTLKALSNKESEHGN